MRLPTSVEIQAARDALAQLRAATGEIERSKYNSTASASLSTLQQLQEESTAAVTRIRHVSEYSPSVRLLVYEHQRLAEKASALSADLTKFRDYRGPRRVKMSTQEKSEFIKANGLDAFEKLPY